MSSGVFVTLFCTHPLDQDLVMPVITALVGAEINCEMVVDSSICWEQCPPAMRVRLEALPSTTPYFVVEPSPFMGKAMYDLDTVKAWIERISGSIQPFSRAETS